MADIPLSAGPASTATRRLPGTGRLLAAQVRYQLLLLLRSPRGLVISLVVPLVLLVLSSSRHGHSDRYSEDALVAGLGSFGLIVTAYVSNAITLVTSRQDGVLRRWRATPLPAWCFFAGKVVATALVGLASVAVAVGAGAALYGVKLTAVTALSLLITFALGVLAWAAIGIAVTRLVPTAQSAGPVLMITYLPVILFSGGLGSVAAEPPWLATLGRYLPAQPVIDAATRALRQAGPHSGGLVLVSGRELAVLAAWAVAGAAASAWFFRWDPVRPRHAVVHDGASHHHRGQRPA
jgi:ABC-2 type transport system permease protein